MDKYEHDTWRSKTGAVSEPRTDNGIQENRLRCEFKEIRNTESQNKSPKKEISQTEKEMRYAL